MPSDELPICSASRLCCKLTLMWPLTKHELNYPKMFYFRLFIFMVLALVTVAAPVMLHLWRCFQEGIDISEDLSVIAAFTGVATVMILYSSKYRKIFELMQELSEFDKYGKPPNFDRVNKKLDYYTMVVYVYSFVGTFVYNLVKVLQISKCREERGSLEVCGTVIKLSLPFTLDSSTILVAYIIYTFFIIFTVDKTTLLVCMQLLELTINIKLRIDQLNSMILDWYDGDRNSSKQRINECVRYHNLIISYSEKLNSCFLDSMFVHIATTGTICGCLENQIVKEADPGSILHMSGWIACLFVACLAGQILMDSSLSVADAAYNSKWYEADPSLQKYVVLILKRSQNPLLLTAGPFNVLCISLFVVIMKMSYSILTLLN